MKSIWRIGKFVAVIAVALAFVGVPAKSEALIIQSVTVTASGNASDPGWTFPRTLNAGQDMVLTADTGTNSFDVSDRNSLTNAVITVVTDTGTFTFNDTNGVLTLKGQDPAAHPLDFYESQPYTTLTPVSGTPGFTVQVGYADSEHTGGCDATSVAAISGLTCNPSPVPSPFSGATIFQGIGAASGAGQVCAGPPATPCWDAGVIRISSIVPEPATMMLLGTGLVGLAARRRMKKGR